MTPRLERESFRAMGTVCAIAATAGPTDLMDVRHAIDAQNRTAEAAG